MTQFGDFDTYQAEATKTAVYPDVGNNFVYPALGLAEEVGEVAGKIKKALRDDGGVITPVRLAALTKELGDVMWYVAALSRELGLKMSDVAAQNITKLQDRRARDTIHGSGDDR